MRNAASGIARHANWIMKNHGMSEEDVSDDETIDVVEDVNVGIHDDYREMKPPARRPFPPVDRLDVPQSEQETLEGQQEASDFRPMSLLGEENARHIVKPFCIASANIIREENFLELPFGRYADQIKRRTITTNGGVYCTLSADGTETSKIGSTKNFRRLLQHYQDGYGIDESRFFIIVDFTNTDESVDERMNETYKAMISHLSYSEELDPFQRFLVDALVQRGGDQFGMKETAFLQMIEIGLKYQFCLAVVAELILFSPYHVAKLYLDNSTEAERLMQHLTVIQSKIGNGQIIIPLQAICSWMSGVKNLSSKIVKTNCILGEQFQDQYVDTLPFPPVANPSTVDEMFDTSKYTVGQKEEARVCVASDARSSISHETRWQRGLAVAVLCNVGSLARGEPVLSPKDRFFNPVHAMVAFYIIITGTMVDLSKRLPFIGISLLMRLPTLSCKMN
ncbi:hypothetical protein IV203_004473 [Nitzschia inconspicua]|uniref:Uncharacterized protein n=1 Tax=Nitzschia inconspicua TaxID=303405 RepID=A0A9K3L4D3_9STRA|nr:hypothetical protein IV203_004473 [Nitzschia inconspicua]